MTSFPYEAADTTSFVPPSLRDIPSPPSFTIRPATRRDRKAHRNLCLVAGLKIHSKVEVREETIKALQALWSSETFAAEEPRLRAYWDALDQHEREDRKDGEPADFSHPDKEAISELIRRTGEAWEPLRQMAVDNLQHREDNPKHLLRLLLAGWANVPAVQFRREAGALSIDTIDDLEEALEQIEAEHAGHGCVPGTAFLELSWEVVKLAYLSEDEAKNFESPSMSSSDQNSSKKAGPVSKDGSSTARRSKKTLAA